ncbi:uncharacterized protein PpBr36_09925 [Pyricularia pennisetigena]|uniref:uncharacterized protein n=1 Tax=Pyricularia pennisetigena TaxID=1578925 RepID=UPI001154A83D|nr:uncharacterized protein PpBr36_09925 [Pyricularia pennisetigena]TLS22440.1 hypothetical protein PpBr36_09925 [Pyricularia pennisetigena]
MKFVFSLSISLLATMGAALPSVTTSDAATLNTRAEPIPCSSGGTCFEPNGCRATIDGKVTTFTDLSCKMFGKSPNEKNTGPTGSSKDDHPGGADVLQDVAGRDGTGAFEYAGHSAEAVQNPEGLAVVIVVALSEGLGVGSDESVDLGGGVRGIVPRWIVGMDACCTGDGGTERRWERRQRAKKESNR